MDDFNCINCDEKVVVEDDQVLFLVYKSGARFYACSMECAGEARDDPEL